MSKLIQLTSAELQEIYTQLSPVAHARLIDKTCGKEKRELFTSAGISTNLTETDISSFIAANPGSSEIGFEHEGTWYADAQDLNAVYRKALKLDQKDGALDGRIENATASIEIILQSKGAQIASRISFGVLATGTTVHPFIPRTDGDTDGDGVNEPITDSKKGTAALLSNSFAYDGAVGWLLVSGLTMDDPSRPWAVIDAAALATYWGGTFARDPDKRILWGVEQIDAEGDAATDTSADAVTASAKDVRGELSDEGTDSTDESAGEAAITALGGESLVFSNASLDMATYGLSRLVNKRLFPHKPWARRGINLGLAAGTTLAEVTIGEQDYGWAKLGMRTTSGQLFLDHPLYASLADLTFWQTRIMPAEQHQLAVQAQQNDILDKNIRQARIVTGVVDGVTWGGLGATTGVINCFPRDKKWAFKDEGLTLAASGALLGYDWIASSGQGTQVNPALYDTGAFVAGAAVPGIIRLISAARNGSTMSGGGSFVPPHWTRNWQLNVSPTSVGVSGEW